VYIVSPLKLKKYFFNFDHKVHAFQQFDFFRKMMEKAAEMQISVGFLDPGLFTSTNISQHSHQVGKAI
jgi:hypothetical protein